MASAATALAAERHGFQLGLYDETGEVPFDTLADVAEFVKRIYIGTGRTDGTDGGVPPPVTPPEPPDEPPDERILNSPSKDFEYKEAKVVWLRQMTSQFRQTVDNTSRGAAKITAWGDEKTYDLKTESANASPALLGAELTLSRCSADFQTTRENARPGSKLRYGSPRPCFKPAPPNSSSTIRRTQSTTSAWRFSPTCGHGTCIGNICLTASSIPSIGQSRR